MRGSWALVVLAGLAAACGPGPRPPPPSAARLTCDARVVHVSGPRWRAEYTFSEPVRSFAFRGRPHPFREGWKPAPPLRLVRDGEKHVVISPAPRRSFALDITATDEVPDKDYRPFDVFTDSGALVYTGHFALDLPGRLAFVAAPDEAVLVQGHARAPEIALGMEDDGTYAYVGSLAPVETPDVIAVVDRSYPPWLRTHIDGLLPPLFAHLTSSLGEGTARRKPLLFATFARRPRRVRDLGGGVIAGGVAAFAFRLGEELVAEPSPALRRDIELVVAHEVVHLWNSAHEGEPATAWMHEGSADALAFRALATLGVYDDATYRERTSTALSLCILALAEGSSLRASAAPGRSRDFYTCGATAALLTELAMQPDGDLFTFWHALFDAAAAHGGRYDEALYEATLARLGKDPALTSVVAALTRGRLEAPARELAEALARRGLEATRSDSLPPEYEGKAGPFAVRAVFAPSCAAAFAFRGDHAAYARVRRSDACRPLVEGDDVTTLAGVDLAVAGASAWDAAFAACRRSGRVLVGKKGAAEVAVPCASTPRERPAYLEVAIAPPRGRAPVLP